MVGGDGGGQDRLALKVINVISSGNINEIKDCDKEADGKDTF